MLSRDNFWGKSCFLLVFYKSFRILSGIVWSFEKITLMVGNTFFHVSRGLSERTKFHHYFFEKGFRTLREKFPDLWRTFGWQGLQKKHFFLPEELCDEEQFFPSEWDNYINFLLSDREFFLFLAKKVGRDFRI